MRTVLCRVAKILALGGGGGVLPTTGIGPLSFSIVLGVSPRERLVLAAILVLMALIASISCAGPVRRSLRIDPLMALRDD